MERRPTSPSGGSQAAQPRQDGARKREESDRNARTGDGGSGRPGPGTQVRRNPGDSGLPEDTADRGRNKSGERDGAPEPRRGETMRRA